MMKSLKVEGVNDSIGSFLTRYIALNENLLALQSVSKGVDTAIREKLKAKGCTNPDNVLIQYALEPSSGGGTAEE